MTEQKESAQSRCGDDKAQQAVGDTRQTLPIRFVGSGAQYFGVWLLTLLLTIVSLGLYYPWSRARRLRFFANHTEVDGHPMDFHGVGQQMFVGYILGLIALFFYFFAEELSPVLAIAVLIIAMLAWPIVLRLALRFRLSKSSWRGLRLSFNGNLSDAYLALMLPIGASIVINLMLILLDLITSWDQLEGLLNVDILSDVSSLAVGAIIIAGTAALLVIAFVSLIPYMQYRYKRYQHDHFSYAGLVTQLGASAKHYYWIYLKTAVAAIACLIALAVMAYGLQTALSLWFAYAGPNDSDLSRWESYGVMFYLLTMLAPAYYFITTYFECQSFNVAWHGTGSTNRQVRFDANLGFWRLFGVKMRNLVLIILTIGLYIPFAKVSLVRLKLQALSLHASDHLDQLIAGKQAEQQSGAADVAAELFDIDIGL